MPSARARPAAYTCAPDMALRRLILRIDRERQRFDGCQMQVDTWRVPLLILNPAHVDLVNGKSGRRARQ